MRHLTQVRIISLEDRESYLQEFPEEKLSFEGYINVELGALFDDNHSVISINVISETKVVVVYGQTI